jgi:hypothetical protein
MKIKANIKGEEVTITLTQEQLDNISNQLNPKLTIDNIYSIEDAEEVLKNCKEHIRYRESQFIREKDWISYQLEAIIKAANYIDNNYQYWEPDFDNQNILKYIPYFEKKASGWVVRSVYGTYYCSHSSVGFYFKERNTADIISNRLITLYNKWLGI